ncbi:MAG: hypothetical protein ACLT78_11580 [Escherichia coli]
MEGPGASQRHEYRFEQRELSLTAEIKDRRGSRRLPSERCTVFITIGTTVEALPALSTEKTYALSQ